MLSMPIALWLDIEHSCVILIRSSFSIIAAEGVSRHLMVRAKAHTLLESLTDICMGFV